LSGPAVLQISSHWRPGHAVHIDLLPGAAMAEALLDAKATSQRRLSTELVRRLPARLAETWLDVGKLRDRPLPEVPDRELRELARSLHDWALVPNGTEGYRKAEVTAGGVDTKDLDSRTMESRRTPGLYFIGEVVDVTGWLGGYNFQWAWASAAACARALGAGLPAGASRL
jgi:predicted Rossmann fold flavoprotein